MRITTFVKDTDGRGVLAPRRAGEELPTLERARELGIEVNDLETKFIQSV